MAYCLFVKPPELRNLDDVINGTTFDQPYDATRAGPMCEQGNRSPDSVDDLNDININDAIEGILEVALISLHIKIKLYHLRVLFYCRTDFYINNGKFYSF